LDAPPSITYLQFQAFLDSGEYDDSRWWAGMPEKYQRQPMAEQNNPYRNHPRDNVSWYQAVAFSRWLNHHMHGISVGTTQASSAAKTDNAGICPYEMDCG